MIQKITTTQKPSEATKARKSTGNRRKTLLTLGLGVISAGNILLSTMQNQDAVSTYSDENAPKRQTLVQEDNALTVGLKDAEHIKDSTLYTLDANKAVISDTARRGLNAATGVVAGIPALALLVDLTGYRRRKANKLKVSPVPK